MTKYILLKLARWILRNLVPLVGNYIAKRIKRAQKNREGVKNT